MSDQNETMLIRLMAPESLRARIPASALSVPSSLNQVGLSAIVAHLLGEEDVARYEFCVNASYAAGLPGGSGMVRK